MVPSDENPAASLRRAQSTTPARSTPGTTVGSPIPTSMPGTLVGSRAQALEQPVDEGRLGGVEAAARFVGSEPAGAVDLRELLHPPRPRRPLDREGVRAHDRRVEVALERPRAHALAAALAHLPQLH